MSEHQGAEAFQHVEGNTASTVMVRGKRTLRSLRTQPHVRTLSRRDLVIQGLQTAPHVARGRVGKEETEAYDERFGEVG